ncbi:hypothetical protein [Muricoccus vinaceus]|uniref:Uncharacterized protein n=1 Tax=Muricoccus vinaceus TaxID=424704 RepID=A0ABV6IXZ5_9PROT
MSALRTAWDELVGLFVDDGALAGLLVLWCAAVGGLVLVAHPAPAVAGALLAVGCVVALLASVLRAARR